MCPGESYDQDEKELHGQSNVIGEAGQAALRHGRHIERNFGIEQSVLRRWVDQKRAGVMDMRPSRLIRSEVAGEVELLQPELCSVTMERDISIKRSATLPRPHCSTASFEASWRLGRFMRRLLLGHPMTSFHKPCVNWLDRKKLRE